MTSHARFNARIVGRPNADRPTYEDFLRAKMALAPNMGVPCEDIDLSPVLLPHQRDIAQWAIRGGRRAIFCSFGLGKTIMQLEVLRVTLAKVGGGRGLIICPLGVRQEFVRDALHVLKWPVPPKFIRSVAEAGPTGIYLTNYETVRDGKINPNDFQAVSLDEASVLRSFGSLTYQTFLRAFDKVRYRFVATATPSPNRFKELIHYAGFLGVMDTGQALAQPLSARVLTPAGWREMGDIGVGDLVIARNGAPTAVLGVYPQGVKPIYEVTFSDGAAARCTGDHLWLTRTQYQRNACKKFAVRNPDAGTSQYWTTKTTDEIAGSLICEATGSKNHEVPLVASIELTSQPVPVDPWLLGFLIGDGCLRKTSVTFTTADQWIVDRASLVASECGMLVAKNEHVRLDGQPNYDYLISGGPGNKGGRGHFTNPILAGIRDLGLSGKRAWEKRIPDAYLFNSRIVRLATLQGLMDADGTISTDERNRTTRLNTTSQGLADDVVFIARSLGGTASVRTAQGKTPSGAFGRTQFIVTLRLPNDTNPFALPRKRDMVLARAKYTPKRYVVDVRRVDDEAAQCIAVADDEHLYVTDDLVVTHNTRFFQRDSTKSNNLTLYPHKEAEFWLWLSSWAAFVQKPSDLGHSDVGYDLPPMSITYHVVSADHTKHETDRDGQSMLFRDPSISAASAAREKRETLEPRVAAMRAILDADPASHYILWHDLEAEREAIEAAVPGSVSIYGSQDLDVREQAIIDFSDGRFQYLAAKPVIAGSGCNFQRHCHKAIFLGVGFKFNDFIQAVHRIQRFQQKHPVEIHIIHADTEAPVVKALQEKWANHNKMVGTMSELIRKNGLSALDMSSLLTRAMGVERVEAHGNAWTAVNNDCVAETSRMPDNSVDLIVTSIPFSNHYEYTELYNDFGHTDSDAHFFAQLDYLTPQLLRVLKPGRVAAIHVKDRILFGSVTGTGMPTVNPFHANCITHYMAHGFAYMGMITIVTDVVRENNQTYRLGWSEQCKDGTKMGVGSPEYVLLFRKLPSDLSRAYADKPVKKNKSEYTRARWQVDAHAFWRSSGERVLTAEELAALPPDVLATVFTKHSLGTVYDYETHIRIGEELEARGALPATFMSLAPGSAHPDVWHDVNRMVTLNGEQARRRLEMHVCPLQFDIVDRLITRFSAEGETVLDPFGGLMTVPYRAIGLKRRGIGIELNPTSFIDGVSHCTRRERELSAPSLFDLMGAAP